VTRPVLLGKAAGLTWFPGDRVGDGDTSRETQTQVQLWRIYWYFVQQKWGLMTNCGGYDGYVRYTTNRLIGGFEYVASIPKKLVILRD
jgi:hypothetical protein